MINADPLTIALPSRPFRTGPAFSVFPFTKLSLGLSWPCVEVQPTFSYHDICPRESLIQQMKQLLWWFRSHLPVRVDSIFLIFVFSGVLFCCILVVRVETEIRIPIRLKRASVTLLTDKLLRVFPQRRESSVVLSCRSLSKINEFPG